jgi:isopentenyl-diphosphate delta-isomerase
VAHRLWNAGVTIIDVAGAGGTSWAAVESRRASDPASRMIAEAFRDWGTPTAVAIADVRRACPGATVIASGGIRDGVDAAKAIRLGADIVGQAAGVLPAALQGADAVAAHLEVLIATLRIACFCTGSANLSALRNAPLVDVGA